MATAMRRRAAKATARGSRRSEASEHATAAGHQRLPEILQALDEEHHFQQRLLKLLEKQVAHLNQRQEPDYEVMHGVMRYMTNFPDLYHHPKEDLVFGKVIERDPSLEPQIGKLLHEHSVIIARGAELMAVIDRCRAEPGKADTHALRKSAHAYIGHLRRHMDSETLRYFPLAQRVLRRADWAEVNTRLQPVLDPVFGEKVAEGFHGLRAHADHAEAAGRPRPKSGGWVEAAAAMEAVYALLSGGTQANAVLAAHNRAVIEMNTGFLRDVFARQPLAQKAGLVRKTCATNARMAKEVSVRLRGVWTEAFSAARRPYRDEATYAGKLSKGCERLLRFGRPADGKSSGK